MILNSIYVRSKISLLSLSFVEKESFQKFTGGCINHCYYKHK